MARSVIVLFLLFLIATIVCCHDHNRDDDHGSDIDSGTLQPICGYCVRYVKGFDITGVMNTVQYTFKNGTIKTACDCFKKCQQHSDTCTNWVWKFTDGSGARTCTLYSNFNLPPNVTLGFNLVTSVNAGVISNNPQGGGLVPHCQLFDKYGNVTGTDGRCISGPLWALDNNKFLC